MSLKCVKAQKGKKKAKKFAKEIFSKDFDIIKSDKESFCIVSIASISFRILLPIWFLFLSKHNLFSNLDNSIRKQNVLPHTNEKLFSLSAAVVRLEAIPEANWKKPEYSTASFPTHVYIYLINIIWFNFKHLIKKNHLSSSDYKRKQLIFTLLVIYLPILDVFKIGILCIQFEVLCSKLLNK